MLTEELARQAQLQETPFGLRWRFSEALCGQAWGQSWKVKSEGGGAHQVIQPEGSGLGSQGLYSHSFQKLQFLAPG